MSITTTDDTGNTKHCFPPPSKALGFFSPKPKPEVIVHISTTDPEPVCITVDGCPPIRAYEYVTRTDTGFNVEYRDEYRKLIKGAVKIVPMGRCCESDEDECPTVSLAADNGFSEWQLSDGAAVVTPYTTPDATIVNLSTTVKLDAAVHPCLLDADPSSILPLTYFVDHEIDRTSVFGHLGYLATLAGGVSVATTENASTVSNGATQAVYDNGVSGLVNRKVRTVTWNVPLSVLLAGTSFTEGIVGAIPSGSTETIHEHYFEVDLSSLGDVCEGCGDVPPVTTKHRMVTASNENVETYLVDVSESEANALGFSSADELMEFLQLES